MPMTRLIYTSRRLDGSEGAVNDILRSSLRNNERDAVTGALIVGATQFTQMLEGHRDKVGNCLARIQCDPRHHDLQVVCANEVRHRLFPGWIMRQFDEHDLHSLLSEGRIRALPFEPTSLPQLLLEDVYCRLAVEVGRQVSAALSVPRSSNSERAQT